MVEDKRSDISKGRKVFLSYLDDDDKAVSGYVILIEINDFVTFQTNQNIISEIGKLTAYIEQNFPDVPDPKINSTQQEAV